MALNYDSERITKIAGVSITTASKVNGKVIPSKINGVNRVFAYEYDRFNAVESVACAGEPGSSSSIWSYNYSLDTLSVVKTSYDMSTGPSDGFYVTPDPGNDAIEVVSGVVQGIVTCH